MLDWQGQPLCAAALNMRPFYVRQGRLIERAMAIPPEKQPPDSYAVPTAA